MKASLHPKVQGTRTLPLLIFLEPFLFFGCSFFSMANCASSCINVFFAIFSSWCGFRVEKLMRAVSIFSPFFLSHELIKNFAMARHGLTAFLQLSHPVLLVLESKKTEPEQPKKSHVVLSASLKKTHQEIPQFSITH